MKKALQDKPQAMPRREALKKAGKYAAFTAIASMIILSPKQSQALSKPGGGWP